MDYNIWHFHLDYNLSALKMFRFFIVVCGSQIVFVFSVHLFFKNNTKYAVRLRDDKINILSQFCFKSTVNIQQLNCILMTFIYRGIPSKNTKKFSDLCNLTERWRQAAIQQERLIKTSPCCFTSVEPSCPLKQSCASKGRSDGAIRSRRGGEVEMRTRWRTHHEHQTRLLTNIIL